MPHFFTLLVLFGMLTCAVPAQAMTADQFEDKIIELLKAKAPLQKMLDLCQTELAGEAKGNAKYESSIYAYRAHALLKAGKLEEARTDNAKALELNPKSGRAAYNQGEILAAEGKYMEAYEHMAKCAARVKNNPAGAEWFMSKARDYREAAAIPATKLWQAFDANEVAAEDIYKGKLLAVTGKISAITTDPAGNPVVTLDAGKSGLAKVHCVFPKEARSTVAALKKGSQILIPGTCAGMTMGQVFFRDCKVD